MAGGLAGRREGARWPGFFTSIRLASYLILALHMGLTKVKLGNLCPAVYFCPLYVFASTYSQEILEEEQVKERVAFALWLGCRPRRPGLTLSPLLLGPSPLPEQLFNQIMFIFPK